MQTYYDQVKTAAEFFKQKFVQTPNVLILAGTGLGDCVAFDEAHVTVPYGDIPHFPRATVKGHKGEFAVGKLGGHYVAVMRGRFHLYEGYSPREVVFPIRMMQLLGAKTMIVTNAAGSITPRFATGDLMLIKDHINLTGENPLVGAYTEEWGDMFQEMGGAYDAELQHAAIAAYRHAWNDELKTGVYVGLKGPSFETPAEVSFYKTVGGNAVGFSTVMEVIAARQAQMRVLGISAITNTHVPDKKDSGALNDVIEIAQSCAPKIYSIVKDLLLNI